MSTMTFEDELGADIQNTRSMRMDPQHPDEFAAMDGMGGREFEFLSVMTGEKFQEFVAYPVIVEMWDKKKSGRHKRAWMSEFTQTERNTISSYYGRFYRWYLISGTPKRVSCKLRTLNLLQRAVNFFASI